MVNYIWRTEKIKKGYEFKVVKLKPLKKPDLKGQYVKTIVIKRGIKNSRAKARNLAKKWVLYYKSKK